MAGRRHTRQAAGRAARPWRDRLLALLLILALAWTQIQAFAHGAAIDPLLGLDICTTDDGSAGAPGGPHDCDDCCCSSVRDPAWLPPHDATHTAAAATDASPAGGHTTHGPGRRAHDRPLPRAPPTAI